MHPRFPKGEGRRACLAAERLLVRFLFGGLTMSKPLAFQSDNQRVDPRQDSKVHQILANRITHATVRRSVMRLLENPGDPLRVSDLIVGSGMSRRGFHKAFAQHMGCSPGRFLRALRIQRAKELLKLGMKIQVVASECGFRKLNTFEIAFKKAEGIAPVQFRRHRNRLASGEMRQNGRHSPIQVGNGLGNGRSRSLLARLIGRQVLR